MEYVTSKESIKKAKEFLFSLKHNNIYLFYVIMTCFGQLTIIMSSLQNSEQRATQ
jgi:hypothetical protein